MDITTQMLEYIKSVRFPHLITWRGKRHVRKRKQITKLLKCSHCREYMPMNTEFMCLETRTVNFEAYHFECYAEQFAFLLPQIKNK